MIAMEELDACTKRMKIIKDNVSDDTEKFVADCLLNTLLNIKEQFSKSISSPNFSIMVKQWKEQQNNGQEKV